MAIKSTIFKVHLGISDLRRQYYEEHELTVARHASETDLRMVLRLVAFALNAHEHLAFTKGLGAAEEPDLWQVDLTGEIQHWIELGQPVEKRLRQSCGKARRVSVYTYQKGASKVWYEGMKDKMERFEHLEVTHLGVSDESGLAAMIDRSMKLHCLIEDGQVLLTDDAENSVAIELTALHRRKM